MCVDLNGQDFNNNQMFCNRMLLLANGGKNTFIYQQKYTIYTIGCAICTLNIYEYDFHTKICFLVFFYGESLNKLELCISHVCLIQVVILNTACFFHLASCYLFEGV